MSNVKLMTCAVCNGDIEPDANGYYGGHNAQPVREGRCCMDCNTMFVVPLRIRRLVVERKKMGLDNPIERERT